MKIVAFISQKGGVGKSTLSRALAIELSKKGHKVKIADCDIQQGTIIDWQRSRLASHYLPNISVESFASSEEALNKVSSYDYLIVDGPARTSKSTLLLAQRANLVVHPVGPSVDDLRPAVREFNAFIQSKIDKKKLLFVLNHVATESEAEAAREYLIEASYPVATNYLLERSSYRQAQNEGGSIVEVSYQSLQKQAQKLIKEIYEKIKK